MKAAVVGAGSWGTALATVFVANQHDTTLWARRMDLVNEISHCHSNARYLPGARLPETLKATIDLGQAVRGADVVLFAVPSGSMVEVVRSVKPFLADSTLLAHAVKGFDLPSLRRMSHVIRDEIDGAESRLVVVTGPSHAEEVVSQLPTTIVAASRHRAAAESLQDMLMNPYLRVYTNPDVVGAEIGGCLKNIIALSVGIADGLGFGDNAKAALMTRGLAEIARIGMKLGASPLTFAGLSGIGDLIVTCTSRHSRNFRTGRLIGQGQSVQSALEAVGMAVEGVPTTKAAVQLASQLDVEMPISRALFQVLFEGKQPVDAVEDLMGRARSHEIEEVALVDISPQWLS